MNEGEKKIDEKEDDEESVYCEICDGCGEEFCCKPTTCKMHPDGRYCESYLNDLKFGYLMFREVYNLINEEKEKNLELLEKIDELWDKNEEKIYGKK